MNIYIEGKTLGKDTCSYADNGQIPLFKCDQCGAVEYSALVNYVYQLVDRKICPKCEIRSWADKPITMTDYTCSYTDKGWPTIRPNNVKARQEFDDNLREYLPYLYRFRRPERCGGDEWFGWRDGFIHLSCRRDPNELVVHLQNKGFTLDLDETNRKR
jgi:hypothetical protein